MTKSSPSRETENSSALKNPIFNHKIDSPYQNDEISQRDKVKL
jgi:hypothetical protein